ncbi:hypothetical protein G7K_2495-t1 [Saitoella complicata NRRL Y-17804]|uniref:protein-tyrosine-phosphatase n=2 Tax=Saitoella complicata (strain BCRC 22490 / CBS 7301 / JCM 7358 / NBRC 10748 / NRRL Y-17804) TaxID=698492 RepID=A0A0E9NEP4_SAICN|nr:hypothetical protein G7K_2495-t1 [Saitoella complicata NRRL Y-17804]
MSLFRSASATRSSDEGLPYFNGPRLIAPNVWLYSEPTRQICEGFDVVINVAREVLDPFVPTELPILSTSGSESGSSDLGCAWRGEYVHIPWEHNTSTLVSELPSLIDLIKTSAEQGKKMLVHCQCGVSRSATLVIAYIMREKDMSLHDAYAYVKERSPWIGPNMGLIYQLSEWGLICRQRSLQPLPEPMSSTADQEKKAFDVSVLEGLKSPTSLVPPPTLGWGNLEAPPVAPAPSMSRSGNFTRPTLPARTRSAEAPEPFAPMVGTPMTDIYTRMERATTVENTSWPVVTAPIVETPMTDIFTRLERGEAQTPVTTEGVIMDEPEVIIAGRDLGVIQEVEIDPRSPRAGVFSGQDVPETPMQANFMSLMEQER